MAIESLPPASTLSKASIETQQEVLSLLFEPSPSLYSKVEPILATTTFETYGGLITAVGTELQCLETSGNPKDLEELTDILSSHPRLGEKKVESSLSRAEQAAMEKASTAESKEEEQAILKQLNQAYEENFPGLRYVVFVNGRPRAVIFEDMKKRIARGDIKMERLEAIQEAMCDIAADRVSKLEL